MALSKTLGNLVIDSDTENGDLCAACKIDGEYRPAVKFCLECCQAICQTCVNYHRRIKHLQGHKIVDNKNQDAVKIAQTLASCLTCPKHPNKNIELICVDHDAFCCTICATVNHRGCKGVREVDDVTTSAQTGCPNEHALKQHLVDAKNYVEEIVKQLKKNGQDTQTQVSQSIPKQVQEMKARVIQAFDTLEKLLLTEAQKLGTKHTYENDTVIAKWQSRIESVNDRATLLGFAIENGTEIHKNIAAKTAEKTLNEVDGTICGLESQLHLKTISLDKSSLLQNLYTRLNNEERTRGEFNREEMYFEEQPKRQYVRGSRYRGYYDRKGDYQQGQSGRFFGDSDEEMVCPKVHSDSLVNCLYIEEKVHQLPQYTYAEGFWEEREFARQDRQGFY